MAISIYDTQAELPPIDFNFLLRNKELQEAKAERSTERDLKAYDDISKLKTTHVQQIPGSIDEARQKEVEDRELGKLPELTDLYSKGKISYKDFIMKAMDIKNNILSPEAYIGNENFKSWDEARKSTVDMKARGTFSPLLHGKILDATGFDSTKGDRWNRYPEAYQPRAVVETLYNNLQPLPNAQTGVPEITPEMIKAHTLNNLHMIMPDPYTQQQIAIARNAGDRRSDEQIAFDTWYNQGLEFLRVEPLKEAAAAKGPKSTKAPSAANMKFTHNPKPSEGEEVSVEPTYKTWNGLNMDLKSNEDNYATHTSALYTAVPGSFNINSPEYKKAEFIKWTDGNIYDKNELQAYGFDATKVKPKNYEYNQAHESEAVFSAGNIEDIKTAKKDIIRKAAQRATGDASYFIDKTGMINPETGEINIQSKDPNIPSIAAVLNSAKVETMSRALENAGIDVTKQDTPQSVEQKFNDYMSSLQESNPDLAKDILENFEENQASRKEEYLGNLHEYAKKHDPVYARNFNKLVAYQNTLDSETENYYKGYNKIPKGWYFDPENSSIDKEWNNVLQTAAIEGSATFLDKKLDPIGAEGKNFVNSPDFVKESGLDKVDGMKIESYYLTDKAGIFFKVRPFENVKGGTKLGNQMSFDIKGDLEQKFMWDYGISSGENDQAIQQKLEHTFNNTARKATSIDVDGVKVAVRKTDVDGSYEVKIKNPITDKIETESGITELSDVTRVVKEVLAGNNQFNNDVLLEGILNAENAQMQNVINDSTGAAAAGYFQMSVKNNLPFFAEFGISNAKELVAKDFLTQKAIANKYLDHIKSEALNTKVQYEDVVKKLGWSTSDVLSLTYFLGSGNLRNWLDTYEDQGLDAAESVIPGYTDGNNLSAFQYLDRVRSGAVAAQKKIRDKYSKK